MNKALLVLALVSIIAAFAGAQAISAPGSIEVSPESKEFKVTVSNGFDSEQAVNIRLASPLGYNIEPVVFNLPAFSSKEFRIRLLPSKEQGNQTINATLIVKVGTVEERQGIEIKLDDFSPKSSGSSGSLGTGFAILPSFEGIGLGTAFDIILIVIIVILIIALFARIANRNRGQ